MSILPAAADWSFPTPVRFGAGRIRELPQAIAACGASRPLLVTDRGLARLPMTAAILRALEQAGMPAALFAEVKPNPTGGNVAEGVAALKAGGHDLVVAFGGGSALDAAKAIALMATQARPIWDFEDVGDNWRRVDTSRLIPVVAVPTTAGTGSELGRASVITHEEEARKVIVFHPRMMPDAVIMDPELTVGLPAPITAATGMDALSHALEAYSAPRFHPLADGIALNALRLIRDWLPRAVAVGTDLEARAQMLIASGMGCVALQKGLGAVHALAHPLGALHDTHHGLLNAVLMPYVVAFNRPAIEPRLADIARLLDLPGRDGGAVIDWLVSLRAEIGLPPSLAAIGLADIDRDRVVAMALADPCAGGNPVPLGPDNLAVLLDAAIAGRL